MNQAGIPAINEGGPGIREIIEKYNLNNTESLKHHFHDGILLSNQKAPHTLIRVVVRTLIVVETLLLLRHSKQAQNIAATMIVPSVLLLLLLAQYQTGKH